jgi:hypothetical protein
LTHEIDDDDHIVEFVSGGPKQYAFRTEKGKEVWKIRGFSLNYANSKLVHFDALKDYILNVNPKRNTTLVDHFKVIRDKTTFEVTSRAEAKHYQPVFRKRVLGPDGISSLPYGW